MTIFVVSDTHFGHRNMLNFLLEDGTKVRPFATVEEMDETLVDNWNRVVTDSDIVYHLGDVYFGDGWKHLDRLKGKKRLVLGNHDNGHDERLQKAFKKIGIWREFKDYDCVLTHVPIHEASMTNRRLNLHGHVHNGSHRGLIENPRYVNCCVEAQNYTPKPIEELVKENNTINSFVS